MQVELRRQLHRLRIWLVFGGSFALRSYEARCLDEWRETLSAEGKRLLDAQRSMLDRYKRSTHDAVVMFYSTAVPNGSHLPEEIRFPLREEESRAATVHLETGAPGVSVKARVVLSAGELLSLEFNKRPRDFARRDVQRARVETHRDVMAATPEPRSGGDAPGLQDLLGERASLAGDVRAPLQDPHREAILRGLDVVLPERYLRLMEISDGFRLGRLRVYGLADIWSAPRPDGLFYVFAAVEGEADLAVKQGQSSERIYWLGHEHDQARALDADLAGVFDRYGSP